MSKPRDAVWGLIHQIVVAVVCCSGIASLHRAHAQPGFLSLACGASTNFSDALNLEWVPDTNYVASGVSVVHPNNENPSVRHLRQFKEQTKNCYTIPTSPNTRYLVRASFFYNNYDKDVNNPIFDIAIDATTFATVKIIDPLFVYTKEVIAFGAGRSFSICLVNRNQGTPFISSLELRPLTEGMYGLPYLNEAYLANHVRINFGAPSSEAIRYPQDPVDRIWTSDQAPAAATSELQSLVSGVITANATTHSVDVTQAVDWPPMQVMQTGVVGTSGALIYRYNLEGFPAQAYALAYFAEIQNLSSTDVRSFSFTINTDDTTFVDQPLNIQSIAGGPYIAFEPSYVNVTFPQFVKLSFVRDSASTLNPLMNAQEIYAIKPKVAPTYNHDELTLVRSFGGLLPHGESRGDPCLPVPWDWVTCTSASSPRVNSILLAGRNLTGSIPSNMSLLVGLQSIDLSRNQFFGPIPDLRRLTNLRSLHLDNNNLSGQFSDWLDYLPNLTEVWVQNNGLTGTIPRALLEKPGLQIRYEDNPDLCKNNACKAPADRRIHVHTLLVGLLGGLGSLVVFLSITLLLLCWKKRRSKSKTNDNECRDALREARESGSWERNACNGGNVAIASGLVQIARYFAIAELREATHNFKEKIGEGGFGSVFRGQLKCGMEVAVKVLANDSPQGAREFLNEVTLLSRVHHRNLLQLIGYCNNMKNRIVVYEYLPKGSLYEHLHGKIAESSILDWPTRLRIALDAAKGLEYLHTGCSPSIIHRDVKTRNILLTSTMLAKVGDFGLSKLLLMDEASHISSTVQGTVGYLDPEYYQLQHLTKKSDVYSFGVVLLELISGRLPMTTFDDPNQDYTITNWARSLLQEGNIPAMVDPKLYQHYSMEAAWQMAEIAVLSVEPANYHRPNMAQVVKAISDAIQLTTTSLVTSEANTEPSLSRPPSISSTGTSMSRKLHQKPLFGSMDSNDSSYFPGLHPVSEEIRSEHSDSFRLPPAPPMTPIHEAYARAPPRLQMGPF